MIEKKLRDRLKTEKFHSLHKKLASAAAREQKHVQKNIFVVTFDHTLSIQLFPPLLATILERPR